MIDIDTSCSAHPEQPGDQPTRSLATYDEASTFCPASNAAYARSVVTDILGVIPRQTGSRLHVNAGTPPYAPGARTPRGHIEVTLTPEPDGPEYSFGIVFGATNDAGRILRRPFNAEAWLANPTYPWSSGIAAFNFDEAWRIVVLLAHETRATRVELGYGLGM
jgi:hypothetical protein